MNNLLKTKSIQGKKSKSDGIRVCIMRRIKPEFEFDIWLPHLAPSTKLLSDYHEEKVNWEQFSDRYGKEVFKKQEIYLKLISNLIKDETITLLCWEEKGENCHRLLLSEKLKEMNRKLEIKHI